VDLGLDRSFFGMTGALSATQVKKLRKLSFEYISTKFFPILEQQFTDAGFEVKMVLTPAKDTDQDPIMIEIYYPHVMEYPEYIQPRVLVEIGSRSLREPFSARSFSSLLGTAYPDRPFADKPIEIAAVNPERTLLEKIFLLHEEFQKPFESIRIERLSRHLYDVDRLIQTGHGNNVLQNEDLYREIVNHRKTITPIRGIDYSRHKPEFINPIPPTEIIEGWKKDYTIMQEQMIHGHSLTFEQMVANIDGYKKLLNQLPWAVE